MSNSRREWISG